MTTGKPYTITLSLGELRNIELTGGRIMREIIQHGDQPNFLIVVEGRGPQRAITSGPPLLDEI